MTDALEDIVEELVEKGWKAKVADPEWGPKIVVRHVPVALRKSLRYDLRRAARHRPRYSLLYGPPTFVTVSFS